MQSILQSIKPVHCGNIATGIKEYELRKTKPKCELPVKVHIYCTKAKKSDDFIFRETIIADEKLHISFNGKVIGEYVCDEIIEWTEDMKPPVPLDKIQLSYPEIRKYGGDKKLYLWHISDLKIYDKPKELVEFFTDCEPDDKKCQKCPYYTEPDIYGLNFCKTHFEKHLTHPPQSWCYVEEV